MAATDHAPVARARARATARMAAPSCCCHSPPRPARGSCALAGCESQPAAASSRPAQGRDGWRVLPWGERGGPATKAVLAGGPRDRATGRRSLDRCWRECRSARIMHLSYVIGVGGHPGDGRRSAHSTRWGTMPRLACWSCGRQIYTVSPLESLFSEERRCPRCGASLDRERREFERRQLLRRQNPPDDPGPPDGEAERRASERRTGRRRAG